jgi:hypothetical protein
VLLTRKTINWKHGLQHLSMRSIFVLQSLLAFSIHQRVTFPYKEETKILRIYSDAVNPTVLPVFLVSNTSIIASLPTAVKLNYFMPKLGY